MRGWIRPGELRRRVMGPSIASALIGACAALALATSVHADTDSCGPGPFGPGGTYNAEGAEDPMVTGMTLTFQCGAVLDDGRFVPRGYRVALSGTCGDKACSYPVFMLTETAEPQAYRGFFVQAGRNVGVRLRAEHAGDATRLVLTEERRDASTPQEPALMRSDEFTLRRVSE